MNNTHTHHTYRALVLSITSALSVWAAMFAWRPLTEGPETFLAPLLVCGLILGLTGGLLRWAGTHPALVVAAQSAIAATALLQVTAGSLVPTPDTIATTLEALRTSVDGARLYTMPVPLEPSPAAPLFLAVGIGSILLADLALTALKVPLVSVPLMVVLLIPTNLTQEVPWWLLALVAVGFLIQLRINSAGEIAGWGRTTGQVPVPTRLSHAGVTLGLGTTALACAVLAGTVVPVADLGLVDRPAPGVGARDQVRITNPLIDMRRNLTRGADVPLLHVTSSERPSYLATTVLADFNGQQWASGERNATADQRADGQATPPPGVESSLPRTTYPMELQALSTFDSRWLALPQHATLVEAEGDWRRDPDTQDYVAWEAGLTTAGLSWTATGTRLDLDPLDLDSIPSGRSQVPSVYTSLPNSLPPEVEQFTDQVTAGIETPFRQARALQDWFRSEFTYSLDHVEPVGNDELVAFLSEDGREGYCEQFAGAMAVMARTLDIPSRVVVGFLSPEQTQPGTWEFSAHDLHAWPELYFAEHGWVRFEPTPSSRTDSPPSYTVQELPNVVEPEETADPTPVPTQTPAPETLPEETTDATDTPSGEQSVDRNLLLWSIALLTLLALGTAVVTTPRRVRHRRRTRRLQSGTPEDLWAELRDTVLDLGLTWPAQRSPRETAQVLEAQLDAAQENTADTEAQTLQWLPRLVTSVEHARYAPPTPQRGDSGTTLTATQDALVDDLVRCTDALTANAPTRARRRARWWPRSVLRISDRQDQ